MQKILKNAHAERALVSLEGRRVRVRGESPSAVYFVVGQRDPGAVVPLNELPEVGSVASLVMDVPPVNPWRRSTWPTGAARTCQTADLIPVHPTRQRDEHAFGCDVRRRSAVDQRTGEIRSINCICGADPIDAGAVVCDPADEVVSVERTAFDSKTAACGPDRD